MRHENECEQCSSTATVPHEGAEDWLMCTDCGHSTKIEKAEWECGNELRWLNAVLQQKWTDQWYNEKWVDVPEESE